MWILNAFSLNMLADLNANIVTRAISLEEAKTLLQGGFDSAVGHAPTAAILTKLLGQEVSSARVNVRLEKDSLVLVAQYQGARLPEGATSLPEGAAIVWVLVAIG
jgi:hypothetical protein